MIKSPFNYMGNKFRQLPQLSNIFPAEINNFLDMFCGGCDVSINSTARHITAIDNNRYIIEILQAFQQFSLEEILSFIDMRINEFQLTKNNKAGYLKYQNYYNNDIKYHTPLDLFVLTRYSFSNLIRFNKKGVMNASFGQNRGGYNPAQKNNLICFQPQLLKINLQCEHFKNVDFTQYDFIYLDPPYFNSGAVYNTKGFGGQTWSVQDDINLFNKLDNAHVPFALSNLIQHKSATNTKLLEWIKDNNYKMHIIGSDYNSCIYTTRIPNEPTVEVCITNY